MLCFTFIVCYQCSLLMCFLTIAMDWYVTKPHSENQFIPNLWQQYAISPVVLNDTLLITLTMFNIAKTEIRVNPWIGWASARLLKGNILLHSLDPWFCTTCRAKKALQISLNSLVCKPFFSLRWLALIINPCGNVKIIVDIPKGTKF